jgi:predicted Zn-dependent protease with MMP-like domain
MVLPEKITIFKNQFEKFFSTKDEIKKAVKNTVWHEIAHHFGMDENQVRNAERKRLKK